MKNKIISLFLLVALIPGLIVPAHAASDTLTVNLLNAVEFTCAGAGSSIVPSFKLTDRHEAIITWNTSIPFQCSSFALGLYSSSNIELIAFNGVLGSLIGNNGSYYQYKFSPGDDILVGSSSVQLQIRFSEDVQHNVNLVSFYGYQSNYINVGEVDYQIIKEYRVIDHSMIKTSVIEDKIGVSLPFEKEYSMTSWAGTPERLIYGITYLNIDPADLSVQYLDSLQVQFTYSGISYHSAMLVDKASGEALQVLDYDYLHSSGNFLETCNGLSDYEVNLYHTCLDIDLAGIDLNNCYIQIVYALEALAWAASTEAQEGFYIRCDWARAILPNEDLPWYTVWGNWLRSVWDHLFDWIEVLNENIVSSFQDLVNNLSSFTFDIVQAIEDWGQEIVDALSPDSSGIDDAADDMATVADDFNAANDILNNMPKPNVSDIQGDISSVIDVSSIGTNAAFLTVLVNQPFARVMMTLSLILCTAAYVLFGKR